PGAGIGGARSARYQGDPWPSRELAIGIGHHRRTAFLAAGDESDGIGVVERVEHGQKALAGNAKHRVGAVDLELVDENLGAGASTHAGSPPAERLRSRREVLEFG